MIYDLFVVGGVFFWILVGLALIGMLSTVVREAFAGAFLIFFAFCVIVFGFSDLKWSWFVEHQNQLDFYAILYLVGAVVTSFFKWYFFLRDAKDRYDNCKAKFLESVNRAGETTIPDSLKRTWIRYLTDHYESDSLKYGQTATIANVIPSAKQNKDRIIGWMAYWPLVAFWSLMDDVLRRVWETMHRLVSRFYQNIASLVFKDIRDEMTITPSSTSDKKSDKESV